MKYGGTVRGNIEAESLDKGIEIAYDALIKAILSGCSDGFGWRRADARLSRGASVVGV
jgi:hypothetical protein